ncbi:MAG: GlsB/YeaQ/YmgE family stress response membrane protein [Desulfovibrionaceae bacterium]|nr:GlsB/YeaQ/YmgE family stress response membrane protein [Desulfovibrionaceae bacterium]
MMTSILITAAIGLVAGFLAKMIMKGRKIGLIGYLIVGLIGGLLGGFLAGVIGLGAHGLIGQIAIAIIGACILLWLLRFVKK